jgi:hypothetical protein
MTGRSNHGTIRCAPSAYTCTSEQYIRWWMSVAHCSMHPRSKRHIKRAAHTAAPSGACPQHTPGGHRGVPAAQQMLVSCQCQNACCRADSCVSFHARHPSCIAAAPHPLSRRQSGAYSISNTRCSTSPAHSMVDHDRQVPRVPVTNDLSRSEQLLIYYAMPDCHVRAAAQAVFSRMRGSLHTTKTQLQG